MLLKKAYGPDNQQQDWEKEVLELKREEEDWASKEFAAELSEQLTPKLYF